MKTEAHTPARTQKQFAHNEARRALALIEKAQGLLYEAAQIACPLWDWCDQWEAIGDHGDATKALWHRINNAPRPNGSDNYDSAEGRPE